MKILIASISAFAATTSIAAAQTVCFDPITGKFDPTGNACNPTAVPEISALEGTAALAALAAIVFIAWERRRRAA